MGSEPFYTHKGQMWIFYFVKWNNRLRTKFDVISRTAIDYMHSVLLGVVKMLLTLWTDKF